MDSNLYAKIKASTRYCRDIETRRKAHWFLEALRSGNVSKTCRKYGIIPKTYYFWWNRFEQAGFAVKGLQCFSRRPKRSPRKTKGKKLKLIGYYRKEFHYGPERIQMYLRLNHGLNIAKSTVGEVIQRKKWMLRKNKKYPVNKHTQRYSLPWPGDRLQMDIKYVPYKIGDNQYYVFNAIDDCSRWRVSNLYRNKGREEAIDFLMLVHRLMPFKIKCLQLDNDSAFTHRFSREIMVRTHSFEKEAKKLDIRLKFIPPGEKELQGKVERLHRTDDEEFFWKAPRCSFNQLQRKLWQWSVEYNHFRHHKELGWKTPKEILTEKYIEQTAQTPYTVIRPPGFRLGVAIKQFRYREMWRDRYLGFLDWQDSHLLPVTDVPGYYRKSNHHRYRRHM